MRLSGTVIILLCIVIQAGCNSIRQPAKGIEGTWQSLTQGDVSLQLRLKPDNRFQVTLNRTGQVHNNLGWYHVEGDRFIIRDSIDYPLPVCNLTDTGRYTFRLAGDTLRFTLVNDQCDRRAGALQQNTFVRRD